MCREWRLAPGLRKKGAEKRSLPAFVSTRCSGANARRLLRTSTMSPVLIVSAPGTGDTLTQPSPSRARTCSEWHASSCRSTVRMPASVCGETPSGASTASPPAASAGGGTYGG